MQRTLQSTAFPKTGLWQGLIPQGPALLHAAQIGQGHPRGVRFLGRAAMNSNFCCCLLRKVQILQGGGTPTPGSAPS